MSDYNKYVFRIYEALNKKMPDGSVAQHLNSPYIYANAVYSGKQPRLGRLYKPGDIIHEPRGRHRLMPNYIMTDEDIPAETRKLAPHKGISVIGLADPQYSLYRPFHVRDQLFYSDADGNLRYNVHLHENMPSEYTDKQRESAFRCAAFDGIDLERQFNDAVETNRFAEDNGDLIIMKDPIIDDRNYGNMPLSRSLAYTQDNAKRMFNPKSLLGTINGYDPTHGQLDYDGPDYFNMLNAIHDTGTATGNQLWLASIPEDALYKSSDVAKGKMRGQRDFPEELVVNRLKLVRPYNLHAGDAYKRDAKADPEGIYYEPFDEDGEGFNRRLGEFLDKHVYPGNVRRNAVYEVRRHEYNRLGKDRQADIQKRARDFVFDNFEIDPDEVISDEAKKNIYRDLSSWYDNDRRNRNAVSALTTGDNRWR